MPVRLQQLKLVKILRKVFELLAVVIFFLDLFVFIHFQLPSVSNRYTTLLIGTFTVIRAAIVNKNI